MRTRRPRLRADRLCAFVRHDQCEVAQGQRYLRVCRVEGVLDYNAEFVACGLPCRLDEERYVRVKVGGLRVDLVLKGAVGPSDLRELNGVFAPMVRQC